MDLCPGSQVLGTELAVDFSDAGGQDSDRGPGDRLLCAEAGPR